MMATTITNTLHTPMADNLLQEGGMPQSHTRYTTNGVGLASVCVRHECAQSEGLRDKCEYRKFGKREMKP